MITYGQLESETDRHTDRQTLYRTEQVELTRDKITLTNERKSQEVQHFPKEFQDEKSHLDLTGR